MLRLKARFFNARVVKNQSEQVAVVFKIYFHIIGSNIVTQRSRIVTIAGKATRMNILYEPTLVNFMANKCRFLLKYVDCISCKFIYTMH